MDLKKIFQREHVTLLDVREPFELALGGAKGAVNIPLRMLPKRLDEIRQIRGPIIAYCRNGNRSGNAVKYLKKQGIKEIWNGGSLEEVSRYTRKS